MKFLVSVALFSCSAFSYGASPTLTVSLDQYWVVELRATVFTAANKRVTVLRSGHIGVVDLYGGSSDMLGFPDHLPCWSTLSNSSRRDIENLLTKLESDQAPSHSLKKYPKSAQCLSHGIHARVKFGYGFKGEYGFVALREFLLDADCYQEQDLTLFRNWMQLSHLLLKLGEQLSAECPTIPSPHDPTRSRKKPLTVE